MIDDFADELRDKVSDVERKGNFAIDGYDETFREIERIQQ